MTKRNVREPGPTPGWKWRSREETRACQAHGLFGRFLRLPAAARGALTAGRAAQFRTGRPVTCQVTVALPVQLWQAAHMVSAAGPETDRGPS